MLAKSSIFIVSIGISFTSGDNDDDDEDVVRIGMPVIALMLATRSVLSLIVGCVYQM